jgi:hypothetical protein
MEIIFWLFDHGNYDIVVNELNDYILNKNPKIVASTLNVIRLFVNNYGHKKIGCLEPFSKNFKLLADSVRPIAKPQTV